MYVPVVGADYLYSGLHLRRYREFVTHYKVLSSDSIGVLRFSYRTTSQKAAGTLKAHPFGSLLLRHS